MLLLMKVAKKLLSSNRKEMVRDQFHQIATQLGYQLTSSIPTPAPNREHEFAEDNKLIAELLEMMWESGAVNRSSQKFAIETKFPIAYESPDHIVPWGTANDNSKSLTFNRLLLDLVPLDRLSVLDLGCSGGGFVKTVLEMGAPAIGIEGSDYSKKHARAEWPVIPDNLFTADVTKDFQVMTNGQPARFSVVTAWEVIEHIREQDLPGLWANIKKHMAPGGIFIGSISTVDDIIDGVNLHQTVRPMNWWMDHLKQHGFIMDNAALAHFGDRHWVRWLGNAAGSFQIVLRRDREDLN